MPSVGHRVPSRKQHHDQGRRDCQREGGHREAHGRERSQRQDGHEAGLLRVGDAGGTSHPTSGEGIGFSLEAGRLAAGGTAEAKRRDDFSAALLSGYARQLKGLSSLRQPSTHAVASLVNRLPRLDLMEPVFAGCETNGRLRRPLLECLIGNKDASALLYRHPAASARAAGAALRKALRAS